MFFVATIFGLIDSQIQFTGWLQNSRGTNTQQRLQGHSTLIPTKHFEHQTTALVVLISLSLWPHCQI